MKKLSLHEIHRRAGAVFGDYEGWEVPLHYGDAAREYHEAIEGRGVSDLSFRGKLRVKGSDRVTFLHNMLTNDIKALKPGERCYAALLTDRAKMVSDMNVFAFEDSFLLDVEPGSLETVRQFLEKYIIADDVTVEDETASTGHIYMYGTKGALPDPHLLRPVHSLEKTWEDIRKTGVIPIGFKAQEVLRIEAGVPRFGTDMDNTDLIMETGITHAISFTKGCYLGQEIVARVTTHGRPTRRLVRLIIPGPDPVKKGEKISKDGQHAGEITSSEFSPSLGMAVALGYVKTEWADPGTALTVAGREGVVSPREGN